MSALFVLSYHSGWRRGREQDVQYNLQYQHKHGWVRAKGTEGTYYYWYSLTGNRDTITMDKQTWSQQTGLGPWLPLCSVLSLMGFIKWMLFVSQFYFPINTWMKTKVSGSVLEQIVKFVRIPNIFGFWKFIEYRILNIFSSWKMNEYEYRIVLFGPNYSNSSNSLRIIRSNTGRSSRFISRERESTREKSKRLTTTKKSL